MRHCTVARWAIILHTPVLQSDVGMKASLQWPFPKCIRVREYLCRYMRACLYMYVMYMHVHVHVHIYTYTYESIFVHTCVHAYKHTNIQIHAIYVYAFVCESFCRYMRACTRAYEYTHTRTYAYIHTFIVFADTCLHVHIYVYNIT
jgi:hypothetical protein